MGRTLWITGLTVFAASYVATGVTATLSVTFAHTRDATIVESWVPLAGPWIMLGDSPDFDSGQKAATVIAASLQTLSAAAFVTGVVLENKERRPPTPAVSLAPLGTPGARGLVLVGTF